LRHSKYRKMGVWPWMPPPPLQNKNQNVGKSYVKKAIVQILLYFSLLYCSNSCTSLHFKTLKSHTKTLKIRPYMFQSPLKPSSGGPWLYFARLLNWKYSHGPPEDGFKEGWNMKGRILSVLVWDFSVLKCSEVHELEQ